MTTKYFNVKNGLTTGGVLISDGNVTLGSVSNVHISGGTNGYLLSTNGSGTLSWIDAASTQSAAPMPTIINDGDTLTIPEFYQGLFGVAITVDGNLEIDGILVDVSGQGPAGTTGQVQYNGNADFGASNGFTFNSATGNLSVPGGVNVGTLLKLQAYSASALSAISGTVGSIACVTDSSPGGQMAYWDITNNRWSYVCDNSAV